MAGLCEGGNEPPGSLKVRNKRRQDQQRPVLKMTENRSKHVNKSRSIDVFGAKQEEEKKLLANSQRFLAGSIPPDLTASILSPLERCGDRNPVINTF
ncbi:hypothetical protein ANN_16303 [Periplaneta americana]|uniref:Uncharacterized protein n=1 Tax=Periplaneta americana TaxID=6978 RepID=A0ABQ8SJD6_PERAM|nr:hypothetical protein ANN_16303 [Periplaneta americana]